MNFNENIQTHICAYPRKTNSVMNIHRQRFSQLNQKFKERPFIKLPQPPTIYPVILPQASRPQFRQQARSKQQTQTHLPPAHRPSTAHIKNRPSPPTVSPNQKYITLVNLNKILHVLQNPEKADENSDSATNTSESTTISAKQRVQQHLQETASRWWRPIRSSESHPISPTIHTSERPNGLQQYPDKTNQLQKNIPLLTVVSNSARARNIPPTNTGGSSRYAESEISTEIPATFVPAVKPISFPRTRQEPLIMQARGMRVNPYDHRYLTNYNNMNFFQQQRLIRQT